MPEVWILFATPDDLYLGSPLGVYVNPKSIEMAALMLLAQERGEDWVDSYRLHLDINGDSIRISYEGEDQFYAHRYEVEDLS